MKAIICTKYGTPDVLQLQEVSKPQPKENEVLIKVHNAVVGPADCAFRKGDPFIVKILYGLSKPRLKILGTEFAGEVVQVGSEVTAFHTGDRVFGLSPNTFGGQAEYMCLSEKKAITLIPEAMSYAQAAAIADGAPTALTFLRDAAQVKSGQSILINGASGAVGVYAVQLAKHFGLQVTAVTSTANLEMVKSLGADFIVDYTKQDFTTLDQKYDVVFDVVAKSSFADCKKILNRKGLYLSTFPSLSIVWQMLWTANFNVQKAKFVTAGLMQNRKNLDFLAELFVQGKLKPVIDRTYELSQVAEAHAYVEKGHKKGNVIINVTS